MELRTSRSTQIQWRTSRILSRCKFSPSPTRTQADLIPISLPHLNCYLYSLAIGSPLSAVTLLISKITTINAKHGPFDACVIVGDLFKEGSDGSEIDGVKCKLPSSRLQRKGELMVVPVPTYFSIGKNALPGSVQQKIGESGGEVTDNLVFLGQLACPMSELSADS